MGSLLFLLFIIYGMSLFCVGAIQILVMVFKLFSPSQSIHFKQKRRNYFILVVLYFGVMAIANFLWNDTVLYKYSFLQSLIFIYVFIVPLPIAWYFTKVLKEEKK